GEALRGQQVDRDHRVPAGGVHVGQQLVAGDAGVVHDDVELSALLLGGLADGGGRVIGGDVDGECGAADPVRGLRELLTGRRDVGADHVRAVAGEHLGDGGADALG